MPPIQESQQVRLLHLSDLHFSEHADNEAENACHSVPLLQGLQRAVNGMSFDRALVSGDITDRGNVDAFLRARDFLVREYAIRGGQTVGLKLDNSILRMVPGNHDAFNTTMNGDWATRWQRSLENYHAAFPEQKLLEEGCSYDWIERDGWGLYIAYADTCLLGDPDEPETEAPGILADKIAKGRLLRGQAKQLLKWYDLGMSGKLSKPNSGGTISASLFSRSFKILMMHHYVFEPKNLPSEYLMRLCNRFDVFRNIALADFDALLCGHKHIPEFRRHTYGHHLERRGMHRFMFNHFRRKIGLPSKPVEFKDENGRRVSQRVVAGFAALGRYLGDLFLSSRNSNDDARWANMAELLKEGLKDPKGFQKRIGEACAFALTSGDKEPFTKNELEQVQEHLDRLTQEELKLLRNGFEPGRLVKTVKNRPFVQIASGSSTKRPKSSDKIRSFALLTVGKTNEGYRLSSDRYVWNSEAEAFQDTPEKDFLLFKSPG